MTDLEQIKRVFKQKEHEKTAVAIMVMLFSLVLFLIFCLDKYF
ncbi:hypothetical protein UFOVP342_38 [uncultured Caudovirales phage]|uniref:Uncharacterized protein n=1 Tax=uncultured Caudovirales phage TaxID=2100421 RepID=A0A6J5M263_9CAUD|nr:hypothetical protein UFOVP342_38 [uncultured Caudovirales phage]